MKELVIAINGQKAVDAGNAFCGKFCYRGIYDHGKRIAQLEVVIDDDGTYNGMPNKWVDVTVLDAADMWKVVKQLHRLGFAGCWTCPLVYIDGCMEDDSYSVVYFKI